MALFHKRKINLNASPRPKVARDYTTSSTFCGLDSVAFSNMDRIASGVASLNYAIYNAKDHQKTKAHSLYDVLKEPNLDERHFNFFYQSVMDYFNGGAYWLIRRFQGEVSSLFRMDPKTVTVKRSPYTNKREYTYNGVTYSSKDVVFIPSRYNYSTLRGGESIFRAVTSVFDTSRKIELYAQKSFDNGVGKRLQVDISGLGDLTDDQISELKTNFNAEYTGIENAHKSLFKKKGIEFSEIGSAGDNSAQQLSENRKLQRERMNDVFQMPQDQSDVEKYFTFLNEFAIKPIAIQFQEAINGLLDEEFYFFEFDYNGLMRTSLQQRIDAYTKQINNGLLSLNEVRAKENLPPIEAGDTHFMPVNMMPWNDETKNAYMAKQKNEANQVNDPTDPNTQHIPQGDDKQ